MTASTAAGTRSRRYPEKSAEERRAQTAAAREARKQKSRQFSGEDVRDLATVHSILTRLATKHRLAEALAYMAGEQA